MNSSVTVDLFDLGFRESRVKKVAIFRPDFKVVPDQLSVWTHFWFELENGPNQKWTQTRRWPKLEVGLKKITQKCNKTSCCIVA